MKHTAKRFAALLAALVLALCLSIPAFAAAPLVRDEMGLFDADTYSQLEASAEAASDGHDCDVYFLVVDSIGDADQRQYAKDYYLANGLGSGPEQDKSRVAAWFAGISLPLMAVLAFLLLL